MYFFYKLFSYIIFSNTISKIILKFRFAKGKESSRSISEKLCNYDARSLTGKLIWIHAASVGEMKSVIPLVKYIEEHTNCHFLISTCTLTSAKLFETLDLKNCTHVFAPLDNPRFVKLFLEIWKPTLGIFIDSELWPNLIVESSKHFPLLSINSRLSDKSFKQWKYFRNFGAFLLSKFEILFPVSKLDCEKFSHFLPSSKIQFLGNLKDVAIPIYSQTEQRKFKTRKKIFLAASTHKGEDQKIIDAFLPFKKDFLLIIVPKHPSRAKEISKIAEQSNLKHQLRSNASDLLKTTEIYIADTIGELDLFYSLADISFVGGSLVKHGGQNFVEAAKHNCLILFGPYTSNFKDTSDKFIKSKAAIIVKNSKDISDILSRYSKTNAIFKDYIANGKYLAKNNSQILPKLYNIIIKYLKK